MAFPLRKCPPGRVGFPWISLDFLGFSRPNRYFSMGYAGFSLKEISPRPFAIGGSVGAAPTVSGMRKRRIVHTVKLNLISVFLQDIVTLGRSLSLASIQKQPAPAGTKRNVDNAK
jgi:hypothetical protein